MLLMFVGAQLEYFIMHARASMWTAPIFPGPRLQHSRMGPDQLACRQRGHRLGQRSVLSHIQHLVIDLPVGSLVVGLSVGTGAGAVAGVPLVVVFVPAVPEPFLCLLKKALSLSIASRAGCKKGWD